MYDLTNLTRLGVSIEDAKQLRRISMTLRRWYELECGDSNDHNSFAIERDEQTDKPFMCIYPHSERKSYRYPVADRENGAKRRLNRIMAGYPELSAYVQTDPRGAALYILRPGDVPNGEKADAWYSRGIAVYR